MLRRNEIKEEVINNDLFEIVDNNELYKIMNNDDFFNIEDDDYRSEGSGSSSKYKDGTL